MLTMSGEPLSPHRIYVYGSDLYAGHLARLEQPLIPVVAIDDDPQSLELVEATLEQDGVDILTAGAPKQGLELVFKHRPPVVVCDLMMPGMSGMEVLERINAFDPAIDVLLLTAHYSTESAVEAIRKGAADYLNKPVSTQQLRQKVDALLGEARKRRTGGELEHELLQAHQFQGIIGRSPQLAEALSRIRRIAPHYRTALITGPTGCGKELAAHALHRLSPAATGPLVIANAAALAETLLESELFGHVKGAFTGADRDRVGLFEQAHGGTLFLDEVGELTLNAQAKLLRAVQQQEIQRVGSPAARRVDVRLVAATHHDLEALVRAGRFREDLFFRLGMVEVRLPALKDRREDLPLLIRFFLERFAGQYAKPLEGLTRRAEALLLRHAWPGNVRELEGTLGYAAMMASGPLIDVTDFPERFRAAASPLQTGDLTLSLDEIQRVHARRVLDSVDGDKVRAAEVLGVSRATLYRLLAER